MNERLNDFEYSFIRTFEIEKGSGDGYVAMSGDPETYCGITIDTFLEALQREIVTGVTCVRELSIDQIMTIYRIMWWMEMRLGEIDDRDIAAEIFDTAVNMGQRPAAVIAQKSCNYLGEHLAEDGVLGMASFEALNRWSKKDKRALFVCLNGFQFIRYVAITAKKAEKRKFARGWTKRIQQYREEK
jgi:lysozyme family protein